MGHVMVHYCFIISRVSIEQYHWSRVVSIQTLTDPTSQDNHRYWIGSEND
jgi:hypothetical protein